MLDFIREKIRNLFSRKTPAKKLPDWNDGVAVFEHLDHFERRSSVRESVSTPVTFRQLEADDVWDQSQTIDISHQGLRLLSKSHTPVGSDVELQLRLPQTGKKVKAIGEVMWIKNKETVNAYLFFTAGIKIKKISGTMKPDLY